MTETTETIFTSAFDDVQQPVKRRWLILPWWIRAFTWLFLLAGALAPFLLIAGLFGLSVELELYGFSSTGPVSLTGSFLLALYMLKGGAGYGLWAQKDWGITVAQIDGLIGVIVCIANLFVAEHTTHGFKLYFRLDIIILVVYLIKLYSVQPLWKLSGK